MAQQRRQHPGMLWHIGHLGRARQRQAALLGEVRGIGHPFHQVLQVERLGLQAEGHGVNTEAAFLECLEQPSAPLRRLPCPKHLFQGPARHGPGELVVRRQGARLVNHRQRPVGELRAVAGEDIGNEVGIADVEMRLADNDDFAPARAVLVRRPRQLTVPGE